MITYFRKTPPAFRLLLAGLVWLLTTSREALGQVSAPFVVGVTTPTNTSNPLPAGSSVTLTAAAVYPAFSPSAGFNGTVNALLVQADGKILVGGRFTQYGTTNCNYIVRLTAAGTLDPDFNASLNGPVKAIAVQPDGSVLVGGRFTSAGTNTCHYVARLSVTGGYDASFAANGTGLNDSVTAVVVQPDGKVLVGGGFSSYGTGTITRLANRIARLTATGKLDNAFRPDTVNSSNPVTALALQADGRIIVGSNSDNTPPFQGATLSPARNYISRLNPNGSLDAAFAPHDVFSLPNLYPTYTYVTSIALQPDGNILIGGYSYIRSTTDSFVRRLGLNGTYSTLYGVSGRTSNSYDMVTALAVQADGKILLGQTDQNVYLRRLTPTGAPDGSLVSGSGISFNSYIKGQVNALAVQPNGQILLGGTFTNYDSTSVTRIARIMPATGKLNTTDVAVPGATYAWSNGSTGRVITALTSGTYSATVTAAGQAVTSNQVAVSINTPTPNFAVRVTPAGPVSLCPTPTTAANAAGRTLTAVVVPAPAQPATVAYQWYQASTTGATAVAGATGSTLVVPGLLTAGTSATYFATATSGGATAASANVTLNALAAPILAAVVPASGLPGTSVSLTGTNLGAVTGVFFGSAAAVFTRTSATQLTATVPAGATSGVTVSTGCATATATFTIPVPPTITSIAPQSGPVGRLVTITGTGFTTAGTATVLFNGVAATVTGTRTDTQLTASVPTGATTGPITVTTPSPVGGTATSASTFMVLNPNNVTISTITGPGTLTAYNNLTIVKPGVFTLNHDIMVTGRLEVQDGATLNDSTFRVLGNSFTLAAGGTLKTRHREGISSSGATGAIQTTTRSFSPDASYTYTGTLPQNTGAGLPSQVRNLTSRNADSLKLTSPVAVAQILTIAGAGSFYLNNQMLTLLSGAGGTALVHNQGTGVVVGTATVQRYIDPSINPTAGFRYYGSPVRGATAAIFKVPAFAYDQRRSLAFVRQDTLPDISVGFVPTPLAAGAFLEVGRGYRAAVPAADTVRFVGTLTTGNDTVTLQRSSRKAYSGWNLVSNPYPSPLNWNKVDPADRPGLEAAIYVYESTGPGKGYFRSYVYKKVGTGDSLIAAGQAFFVRVRQNPGTQASTGRLIFRNSQRVTTFDSQAQPTFNRTTALQLEPQLDIDFERNGSRCPCRLASTAATPATQTLSRVTVYTNSVATSDFDPLLDADAGNLINLNQQTLGIRIGGSTRSSAATDTLALLAVQALPLFNPARIAKVPLVLGATAPGLYTLGGTGQNLPALLNGATAYLRDSSATTNNWITLPTATPYAFLLTAAELLTKAKTVRFWLHFGPGPVVPLATTGSAALQSATVYPNPAHGQFSVRVPTVAGATQVQATLLSPLGQVVQQQIVALPATGTTMQLSVPGQASGMYLLRLQAGSSTVMRRVILDN